MLFSWEQDPLPVSHSSFPADCSHYSFFLPDFFDFHYVLSLPLQWRGEVEKELLGKQCICGRCLERSWTKGMELCISNREGLSKKCVWGIILPLCTVHSDHVRLPTLLWKPHMVYHHHVFWIQQLIKAGRSTAPLPKTEVCTPGRTRGGKILMAQASGPWQNKM